MKKHLLLISGWAALFLGLIGIFLPLLPTTPFLLLSAACFCRSSPAVHAWLMEHPILGKHLRNWYTYHAISRKAKISALVFLWLSIGISIVWIVSILWIKLVLAVIALAVTLHIARIRTI